MYICIHIHIHTYIYMYIQIIYIYIHINDLPYLDDCIFPWISPCPHFPCNIPIDLLGRIPRACAGAWDSTSLKRRRSQHRGGTT